MELQKSRIYQPSINSNFSSTATLVGNEASKSKESLGKAPSLSELDKISDQVSLLRETTKGSADRISNRNKLTISFSKKTKTAPISNAQSESSKKPSVKSAVSKNLKTHIEKTIQLRDEARAPAIEMFKIARDKSQKMPMRATAGVASGLYVSTAWPVFVFGVLTPFAYGGALTAVAKGVVQGLK